MTKFDDMRELNTDELNNVSGGDLALDIAVKAYEDMCKRIVAAVHQPITQPTSPLHF
jgi:bacteriocin-like protein